MGLSIAGQKIHGLALCRNRFIELAFFAKKSAQADLSLSVPKVRGDPKFMLSGPKLMLPPQCRA